MAIIFSFFFFTAIVVACLLRKHINWLQKLCHFNGHAAAGVGEEDGEKIKKYGADFCAVCLSQTCHGEEIKTLPVCYHSFHVDCIDAWLKNHSTCPLCRNKISDNLNHDLNQGKSLRDSVVGLIQNFSALFSTFCCLAFQPKIVWETFHYVF
ncbi:hypothetical protein L6164_021323 [Bauhinia variegata]|uniref:Uncharacterized protein n=1 Tax=Bauhinia variegata TaxID=167791 RepID=A0ACB9MYD2_BAUVA|nr:hypothetical protein L6164_021323 [Bauhinia variegata]